MKKQITLRIDENLLDWFKSKGKGYHKLMHKALEKYRMFNTPHIDLGDYYKDQEDTSGASGSGDEFIDDPEINYANDQFFKPMPKKGKGKKNK